MDKWVGFTLADVGMWHCEWSTIAGEYGCCNCGSSIRHCHKSRKWKKKCQGRVLLVDKHFGFTLDLLWLNTRTEWFRRREVTPVEGNKPESRGVPSKRKSYCCGLNGAEAKEVCNNTFHTLPPLSKYFLWMDTWDKLLTTSCGKARPREYIPPSQFFTFLLFLASNTFFLASPPVIMWKVMDSWHIQDPKKERRKLTLMTGLCSPQWQPI